MAAPTDTLALGAHTHPTTRDVTTCARGALPAAARHWTLLAVGSLVVAGLLSLSVVVGRLPAIAPLITDPMFFRRCLVVHVDLALLVWFYAFLATLAVLRAPSRAMAADHAGLGLAVAGVAAMLAGAVVPGALPVLANYIPVIDHWLFLGGLATFFSGLLVVLVRRLLVAAPASAGGLPGDAAQGVQAACVAVVLAATTWISAQAGLPAGLDPWTHHEFSAWGAGHVLQVANVAAMMAVWLWLVKRATGSPALSPRAARLWFTLLVAPHFAMPLLTYRGALNTLYIDGATQLMRWGLFPVATVVLAICARHVVRHPLPPGDPLAWAARAGFVASAGLTSVGFLLGAMIRGSTTLIPAHYHASLGAVTVSFMAAAYLVLEAGRGREALARVGRAAARQLRLFGAGQVVFAAGFAVSGWFGLARKAYGSDQVTRGAGEIAGLWIMGFGGLVAVAGGLWFLFLALRELRAWRRSAATAHALPHPTYTHHERP